MPEQKLLEGEVMDNTESSELVRMRELNRSLTRELSDALTENEELRKRVATADAPIARLRRNLEPFYKLLQSIFDDIDDLDLSPDETPQPRASNAHSPIWESWKQKLGGQCARIIDVLLTHGEMNTTQLAIAIQTRRQNIPNLIYKLNQAGLINKNGGRFSLKQL